MASSKGPHHLRKVLFQITVALRAGQINGQTDKSFVAGRVAEDRHDASHQEAPGFGRGIQGLMNAENLAGLAVLKAGPQGHKAGRILLLVAFSLEVVCQCFVNREVRVRES